MTRDEFFAQSIIQCAQRVTDLMREVFIITTPHESIQLELPRYYSRTKESIAATNVKILNIVEESWEAFNQEGA